MVKHFGLKFCLLIVTGLSLYSCGLRYTPGDTPEDVEEQRRFMMQEQLSGDYKRINKTYKPLTYGKLTVVKPVSYVKLDSLFEQKYRRRYEETADLDRAIDYQKAVIQNDTTPVLYVETHWYELIGDSTSDFITAEISMTRDHRIRNIKTLDEFEASKQDVPYAETYMMEESMFNESGYLNNDENNFYSAYKKKSATLSGAEKDKFMAHTFELMRLAAVQKSYATEGLLRSLARKQLEKDKPGTDLSSLKFDVSEVVDNSTGKSVFMYYEVLIRTSPDNGNAPIGYRYDSYLQPVE